MTAEGTEIEGDKGTLRVDMTYRFEDIETFYIKTSRMTVQKTAGRLARRP